jgi:hypothetical protein
MSLLELLAVVAVLCVVGTFSWKKLVDRNVAQAPAPASPTHTTVVAEPEEMVHVRRNAKVMCSGKNDFFTVCVPMTPQDCEKLTVDIFRACLKTYETDKRIKPGDCYQVAMLDRVPAERRSIPRCTRNP